MQIKTKGLILREVKTGEADRILTILTPEHGLLSASAKSSMRLKNKLFAATGLFCYSDFVLFSGKSMYIVDEATPIEVFFGLRDSIEKMSLAMYLAELTATLAQEEQEAESLMRLILNSFYLIAQNKKSLVLVKTVFELRAISASGFMPDLTGCAACGEDALDSYYFDLQEGTLLCEACAAKKEKQPNIAPGQLAAMHHILYSGTEKLYAFTLGDPLLEGLSRLSSDYVSIQLDHRFKTLDFLRGVL